jgi:hypothetical protein
MAFVFVIAMATSAIAGPPGHGEKAFGKGINYHCDASYGQLVSAAIQSDHIDKASGARAFATSPNGLALHCLGG